MIQEIPDKISRLLHDLAPRLGTTEQELYIEALGFYKQNVYLMLGIQSILLLTSIYCGIKARSKKFNPLGLNKSDYIYFSSYGIIAICFLGTISYPLISSFFTNQSDPYVYEHLLELQRTVGQE